MSTLDIEHLARLAQIRVTAEARPAVEQTLANIIDMIDQMQAIPTDGVEPLAHPLESALRLRADEVTEANHREEFQREAPQVEDGLYLVPRVVE